VTGGDNSNIMTARIARETYEIENVVARIQDPRRATIYQRLGIATMASVAWATDQVMRRLNPDSHTIEWTDANGAVSMIEVSIPTAWAGQKLTGLSNGDRHRLVAISRGGTGRLATEDVIGQEGDVLHLMVQRDSIAELDTLLDHGPDGGPH
jgi:trk system potassium uptake protein TrkA